MRRRILMVGTLATLAGAGESAYAGGTPTGPNENSTGLKRPVDVTLKISGWCDNTGSDINLVGSVTLAGTAHRVTLANNVKGTHAVQALARNDITISGDEGELLAVKPPAFGGVGGNPWLVYAIKDTAGNVIAEDVLTRCVTGAHNSANGAFSADIHKAFTVNGGLSTWTGQISSASNGSDLDVRATDWADGVDAQVLLVSQINKLPGQPGVHWAETDIRVQSTIHILDGTTKPGKGWWVYADGTRVHGPGGNPVVYDLAPATSATPWSQTDPTTWGLGLGRCNKLPLAT